MKIYTVRGADVKRQFCRKGAHTCVPAVTLTFDGGARRLHWCAEHADDAEEYRDSSDQRTADADTAITLNETITHLPNYDGHWKGEAYQTHHWYGVQIHRTRHDAERWNTQQRERAGHMSCPRNCGVDVRRRPVSTT